MLFGEVSQFCSFWSKNFGLSVPQPRDFKNAICLSLSVPRASLRSILCRAIFVKIRNLIFRIFDFLSSKSEIVSSPFLWYMVHFHTPSTSHGAIDISTFARILRCVLSTNAFHFCIFHFFGNFFPSICENAHQGIVSIKLYNTRKAFISTTP